VQETLKAETKRHSSETETLEILSEMKRFGSETLQLQRHWRDVLQKPLSTTIETNVTHEWYFGYHASMFLSFYHHILETEIIMACTIDLHVESCY